MNAVLDAFLMRNVPRIKDNIDIDIIEDTSEYYSVTARDGRLHIEASTIVAATNGLYDYLKTHLGVQLSWCGNREICVDELVMFDGEMRKVIKEKWRVYMNYCTLCYSMAWWDEERWMREIDFMALNGINMPLGVVGSEAVWYETLIEMGWSKAEALSTISGPAFSAWQLMTNIEGYMPPPSEKYVYERLELGRKILARYRELGMTPIMQGFSGHVPLSMIDKYPHAKIYKKRGWCLYPKTAELDALDPLFREFGTKYLNNMERLLGNSHYIACDPFHEGVPPKSSPKYLYAVGKAIHDLYESFDKQSVWVMQGWTPRLDIMRAVPIGRLLVLDLPSDRAQQNENFLGHETVAGMLHDFGGKNAMQGQIRRHAKCAYKCLKDAGVNVVGTGMFMEGIEQNPVVYDLQFKMLTESEQIDFDAWLKDYIKRRYGAYDETLMEAWSLLMRTCYSDTGYEENAVGSTVAARPHLMPKMAGPCCSTNIWYDTSLLEHALALFYSVHEKYAHSDGYLYDLVDLTRQVLSNRFATNEQTFKSEYKMKHLDKVLALRNTQLGILLDMDELLSHRSELCLDKWLSMAHTLATDDEEKRYFDRNARTLITLWGDIDGDSSMLYDYSWREWSGHIKNYYYVRWSMFYDEAISALREHRHMRYKKADTYKQRRRYKSTPLGKKIYEFELSYINDYRDCEYPKDTDPLPSVDTIISKYNIV